MAEAFKDSLRGVPVSQIEKLTALAKLSGYRVGIVAAHLGHSSRWLEHSCRKQFGLTPRRLLARLRDNDIQDLARKGLQAKVICQLVGFADAASFCHSLKRSAGCTLRELRELSRRSCSQKDNNDGSHQTTGTSQTLPVFPRRGTA